MALEKQVIRVKFSGLDGATDPKGAPPGRCDLLENFQTLRMEDGGFEIEKRYGTTSLTKAVDPFTLADVTAGRKLAAFGNELVMTDGKVLYSWTGSTSNAFAAKGRCPSLSAVRAQIEGIPSFGVLTYNEKSSSDAAYAGGWAIHLVNFTDASGPGIAYYVIDTATGARVFKGTIAAYRGRVLAIGSTFYLFTYDATNGLSCYTTTTSSGLFGSRQTVVAAASMGSHFFDATVDTANGRLLVGYRNTTPGLTLKIWNANNTAGASANYNTRDPGRAIGFLHQDWTVGGNVYVGIGTTIDVRALTFDSSLAIVDDTQSNATVSARNVTGWREASSTVLISELSGATSDLNRIEALRTGGSTVVVKRGVGLVSRVFKVGTTYHYAVALESTTQRHMYLLEAQPGGSASNTTTIEALLMAEDAGGLNPDAGYLGGPALLSSDRAWLGCMGQLGAGTGVSGSRHYTVERFDLRFNDDLLGPAVAFNGTLHIPGACPMVYDGADVHEEGFLAFPEAPVLNGADGSGAAFGPGTWQYLAVFSRIDHSGRVSRSAAGPVASVTLVSGTNAFGVTVSTLRMVTIDNFRTIGTEKIEIYRTRKNESNFYLVMVLDNDPTADTITGGDNTSDAALLLNEPLYLADSEVDNAMPPAILAVCKHRDRLFALSGDGALYFTKEAASIGDTAAFSSADGFFMDFDQVDGDFTGLASDGTTLFVSKRAAIYPVQGDGPDLAGNGSYAFPEALPAKVGFLGPRTFVHTPDGIVCDTSKGKHLVDRAGGIKPLLGADAYDSLAVTAGLALDDRPMALLTTSDGRTLAWDWQNQIWHTWTGQAAVAACLWQRAFAYLDSAGKVHVEVAGSYSDDGAAIAKSVEVAWLDLTRGYVYRLLIYGEALATCTLSGIVSYNYDASTAETAKTIALTTASKTPWVLQPDQGYCEAIQLKLTESSATRGVKLSRVLLEVGLLPGAELHGPAQYMA